MKLKAYKAYMQDKTTGEMIIDHFLSERTVEQFCEHHGLKLFKTEVEYIESEELNPCGTV